MLDPTDGYYSREKVFGKEGDFITSPEISQSFGEVWNVTILLFQYRYKALCFIRLLQSGHTCNGLIWEDGNFQYPSSEIEIICFDSGYTIIKLAKKELSDKFKKYFGNDAIELEKFRNKYMK